MTFADQVRLLTHLGSAWALHISRVALLGFLAAGSLVAVLRLGAARALARRGGEPPGFAGWLARRVATFVLATLACGYAALRPDEGFFAARGDAAVRSRDYAGALTYLEPLADWGSRRADVYHNLAAAELFLGRYRRALDHFARAEALGAPPSADRDVLAAAAHAALGETGPALQRLERAETLAQRPDQRSAILAEIARLRGASTGPAPAR